MKAVHRLSCFRSDGLVSWAAVAFLSSCFIAPPYWALSAAGATLDLCPLSAGTVDSSFFRAPTPPWGWGVASVVNELPDGKLMVGMFGTYSYTNGSELAGREVLVRLNQDGTLDPSFVFTSTNFYRVWQTHALAVASNGLMAVATSGYGTDGFYHGQFHLLRPDGSVILASETGGDDSALVRALAWQPDGRLLIGGNYGSRCRIVIPGVPFGVARLLPESGTVDTSFTPPPNLGFVTGLAVDRSGRILVHTGNSLLRLLPGGALDPTFQPASLEPFYINTGLESMTSVALDEQGRVLVSGVFTNVNGVPRARVARLHPNGALDLTFNPVSTQGELWSRQLSLALQTDGKILVGGSLAPFSSAPSTGLVRLRGDGSLDPSFEASTVRSYVSSICLRRGGRVLVTAGLFSWEDSMSPYQLLADPQPRLATPEFAHDGSVRLRLDSVPGAEYVLQSSTNLTTWHDVGTKRAEACTLAFTNSLAPRAGHFFRVRRPTESELGR